MARFEYGFHEEDMVVDEGLGFPKAYAKMCRDGCNFGAYSHGPPFTFTPFALHQHEVMQVRELDKMFPVLDPKAKPTTKPKIFVSLLWKQLNHLGNAGFDPAVIRVDPYGNVLFFHADKASPLAWDIDHWFPCSRGGLTVPSNLRILQWQVCKRKHNKLEFLVPWWDFQLGISVNQFLSIFAASNSDFRHRAFSFLFLEGESEELNDSQTVDSHSFPQHFIESKKQLGLAPAAVVLSGRESYESSSALKLLDYNRQIRSHSPAIAARKSSTSKENENPDFATNPYQAIVVARDSLRQREEAQKMQTEIQKLDDEVDELKRKNDEEKLSVQDLELQLIKRRRRAEKCRRLAEAQSSYRTMLEKMIRDAMHQSVVYKEQVRLNQAASNALMARLEAQKAICDAAEKDLHKKYKQRDELEKQIRPECEQARKRSRMEDTLLEDRDRSAVLYLPGIRPRTPLHKELRVFLEEEQRASEAGLSANEDRIEKHDVIEEELKISSRRVTKEEPDDERKSYHSMDIQDSIEHKLQALAIEDGTSCEIPFPILREPEPEEDEESRQQRGKGNVERWLQLLLENSEEQIEHADSDDIIKKLNQTFPQKEATSVKHNNEEPVQKQHEIIREKDKGKKVMEEEIVEIETANREITGKGNPSKVSSEGIGGSSKSFEGKETGKGRKLTRSESARTLRRIPSSPSLILGIKKGVECMIKKPSVTGDDCYNEQRVTGNSFIKNIKKAVKI